MKRTILTFVLVVAAMMAMGQTKVVWEKPTTEFRSHNGNRTGRLFLDVTRVELMDMETLVYITVCKYDYPKSFKSKYISRVSSSLSFSVKKRNLLCS